MSKQHTQGTIVDFGYEEYKGKDTFYLVLQNDKGQTLPSIRGKGLEEAFQKVGDLQKGEKINLIDLDIDEVSKKRLWEIERFEPQQNLENAIERDVERELQKIQTVDKTKENVEPVKLQKPKLAELEDSLPDSIKNNYVAIAKNRFLQDEKINYYDKTDPDKVNIAFEDRKNGLHTSRQDEKTVKAMMDLAESKGWTAIKLKGTEEFKQKAWLEASLRGIETKGYEPTEKDKAELIAKKEARTVNNVEATAIVHKELLNNEANLTIQKALINESQAVYDEQIAKGTLSAENLTILRESLADIDQNPYDFAQDLASHNKNVEHTQSLMSEMQKQEQQLSEKYKPLQEKDIKAQIREITQNGYKDGTIANRKDLVNALTDRGYEVVKENEKSIRLKIPYSDQHLTLKGEMFTKDFDAIKQLKASLEPEAIKERYPQISDVGIAQLTAWKNHILENYKTPQAQQEILNRLETSVVDVANGKDLGLPKIPDNEIQPDIQIQIPTTDKSRSR